MGVHNTRSLQATNAPWGGKMCACAWRLPPIFHISSLEKIKVPYFINILSTNVWEMWPGRAFKDPNQVELETVKLTWALMSTKLEMGTRKNTGKVKVTSVIMTILPTKQASFTQYV